MSNKKEKAVKAIKGFDSKLQCRGYQYEVGKTYTCEGEIKVCENGFHAIPEDESPMNVFDHYPPCGEDGKLNRYCEVEVSGDTHKNADKIAGRQITIGAEIGIPGLVKAHVEWVKKCLPNNDETSGYWAKIGSSCDGVKIGSSGDVAKIGSIGDGVKIGSSGYGAKIGSSGDGVKIGSSGDVAKIGSSGDVAKIGSSGYGAQIGSSGYGAQIGSSGDWAKIASSGYASVICCAGHASRVKARVGSWITLSEWEYVKGEYIPVCVKTEHVDGERIKADTWYTLNGGEFVEVKE